MRTDLLRTINRYWSKVDKTADCWIWTGEKNNMGYGRFEMWTGKRDRERLQAHRFALILAGRMLGDDDVVLHTCDNPPCVRPDHLRIGTQAENLQDAQEKGRTNLDGFFRSHEKTCPSCGKAFIGFPNERYCDAHKITSAERSKQWRLARKGEAA